MKKIFITSTPEEISAYFAAKKEHLQVQRKLDSLVYRRREEKHPVKVERLTWDPDEDTITVYIARENWCFRADEKLPMCDLDELDKLLDAPRQYHPIPPHSYFDPKIISYCRDHFGLEPVD